MEPQTSISCIPFDFPAMPTYSDLIIPCDSAFLSMKNLLPKVQIFHHQRCYYQSCQICTELLYRCNLQNLADKCQHQTTSIGHDICHIHPSIQLPCRPMSSHTIFNSFQALLLTLMNAAIDFSRCSLKWFLVWWEIVWNYAVIFHYWHCAVFLHASSVIVGVQFCGLGQNASPQSLRLRLWFRLPGLISWVSLSGLIIG